MLENVKLYVDDSEQSKKAEELLRRSRIGFILVPSSGPGLPSAQVESDLFTGLPAIALLAQRSRQGPAI
jgi:hypothetical protein